MKARLYKPTETETDAAIAAIVSRQPGCTARFAKAAALVLAGAVGHDGEGWTVTSQDKYRKGTVYRLSPGACTCYEHTHGGRGCKHLDALQLYARVLGAKLDAQRVALQDAAFDAATATGWHAFNDALTAEDALAAAEYAASDPVLGDDVIFVIPGQGENRRLVYDRVTGDCILTAQQQPSGAWRPAEAKDTLAWARWLGAQQGEEEGAEEVPVNEPAPTAFAARAAMWAEAADDALLTVGIPKSAVRFDEERASKYGHAPIAQLQHEANARRNATQARRMAAQA